MVFKQAPRVPHGRVARVSKLVYMQDSLMHL